MGGSELYESGGNSTFAAKKPVGEQAREPEQWMKDAVREIIVTEATTPVSHYAADSQFVKILQRHHDAAHCREAEQPHVNLSFEDWWEQDGKFYDPDTQDVPWFDKRKFLAEYAVMKCREAEQRPFCDGCDHGVVNGKVCEVCKGTGYQERRVSAEAEQRELKSHRINRESARGEVPNEVWVESCGTLHIAIRILRHRMFAAEASLRSAKADAYKELADELTSAAHKGDFDVWDISEGWYKRAAALSVPSAPTAKEE